MNRYIKALFILTIPILFSFNLHKYYISFTKIDYSKESKSLQITMKVFTDDLEKCINNQFNVDAKLNTNREINNVDNLINTYIEDKFYISVNNSDKKYTFLGKEYEKDETTIYLEIENINDVEVIQVINKTLMEVLSDQQNIIKINIDNAKKSFIFTRKDHKNSFYPN